MKLIYIISALTAVLMQTLRTLLDPENMGPQTNQGINVSAVAFVFFVFFLEYLLFLYIG